MRGRASLPWPSLAAALVLAGCGSEAGDTSRTDSDPVPRSAAPAPAPPSASAAIVRARPDETLGARVVRRTAVLARPSPGSRVLFRVGRRTEFDSPAVMAVMRQRGRWIGVSWPDLPNGSVGWVRQERVELLRELWRIDVDLSDRRAVLRRKGTRIRSFPVAVGAPGTSTPPGRYGVTDRLTTGGPDSSYGCCVLALSGRQPNVPQDWPGGDRLAIHGTSAPASIGQAASAGCLRASEESMRLLIAKVPLGTQVVIRP
ncbi:MAG: L,D-transpeptidase [Solirubrobacteraceae bacterium]